MTRTLLFCCLIFAFGCKKNKDNNTTTPNGLAYDSVYNLYLKVSTNAFSTIRCSNGDIAMLTVGKYNWMPTIYRHTQDGALISYTSVNISDSVFGYRPYFVSIAEANDGNFLLCGRCSKKVPYNGSYILMSDIVVAKVNRSGDMIWHKSFGGDREEYGYLIMKTLDGNYLIGGKAESYSKDYYNDIYLVKIDDNGDMLWSKNYDAPEQQDIGDILETPEGNLFLSLTDNYGTGHSNLMWMMTDNNGNILWQKRFAMGTNSDASRAAMASNGDFILTYTIDKLHITRIDASGNQLWDIDNYQDTGNMNFLFSAVDIKANSDNTFTVAGNAHSTNPYSQLFMMKIDGNGKQLFIKTIPGDYNNVPLNLLKADNGNNFITGNQSRDTSVSNVFFIKTNNY